MARLFTLERSLGRPGAEPPEAPRSPSSPRRGAALTSRGERSGHAEPTGILVTIRCEKENLDEAINTLRFAQRAKNVTVNLVSNATARDDAKPKAAKLAEELSMATAALGDFETKHAAALQPCNPMPPTDVQPRGPM